MIDRHRPWLSLYTALAAITTALLTVGFAGLLTPVPMMRFNEVSAVEVDMTTDIFKDWVSYRPILSGELQEEKEKFHFADC